MTRLRIDGVEVVVEPGTTVLAAARSVGRDIPTLCFDQRLARDVGRRLAVQAQAAGQALRHRVFTSGV